MNCKHYVWDSIIFDIGRLETIAIDKEAYRLNPEQINKCHISGYVHYPCYRDAKNAGKNLLKSINCDTKNERHCFKAIIIVRCIYNCMCSRYPSEYTLEIDHRKSVVIDKFNSIILDDSTDTLTNVSVKFNRRSWDKLNTILPDINQTLNRTTDSLDQDSYRGGCDIIVWSCSETIIIYLNRRYLDDVNVQYAVRFNNEVFKIDEPVRFTRGQWRHLCETIIPQINNQLIINNTENSCNFLD
ncbi:MAG: hypothetical protein NZ811_01545, partial [Gammaproteobacteria bacterium]|nr:hypothetical protein [Gammaproteobacteria bacterium]